MYQSPEWKERRAKQLEDQPWCEDCLKMGVKRRATDADHEEPHRGDPVKFFQGRLRSRCHSHHSAKTNHERAERGEGGQKSLGDGGNITGLGRVRENVPDRNH